VKGRNLHTKEIFDRAYSDRSWEWYRSLVATCIRHGKPGKWIDLGAGFGLFVECAKKFGINCIGIEGAEYAVKVAKERFPGIDIRQHFLDDRLPFKDDSISTIMCYQTIEHLSPETARFMLKECHRVLIKEGVILIYSPCMYEKNQSLEETHINLYTPSSLTNQLEGVGFKVKHTLNTPRMLIGDSRIGKHIMSVIYGLFPSDFFSATANCIAVKPG